MQDIDQQKETGASPEAPAVTQNNIPDSSDTVLNVEEFTAPLPDFPIIYSRGKNTFDNQPEQRIAQSWTEFFNAIDNDRGTAKGQQYICGSMRFGEHSEKDKYPQEAHYRGKDFADDSMVLPLDCDGMPAESFDPLLSLLSVFQGCSYTTSSHTKQNPHTRAFVALSRDVNRSERMRVGKAFEQYIVANGVVGVKFDPSVYKTEQQCYLPLKGAAFYDHRGGFALDVDKLLSSEHAVEQPVSTEASGNDLFPDLVGVKHAFNEDVKEGGRSDSVLKYIGYVRKRDTPEELLNMIAMNYNVAHCKPPLDYAEVCDLVNRYKHQANLASDSTSEAESNSVDWPEIKPLPPKNPPTPSLEIYLLPSTIQAYVKDCAERLQVPPEMVATPLLISFGNVIGKKAAVYPKRNDFSWYEYPNLWGCCVAPPASLKSPALMAGLRFSREIETDMRAIYDRQLRSWKLNEKLRKASSRNTEKAAVAAKEAGDEAEAHKLLAQLDELDPPVCGRLTTTDATPEARLELLRQNPNGLMQVVDELDGHFQRLSRDGYESARAQELTFYDGKDDYAEDRVKRGSSFVESPRVAMYGNLQPAKVEGYMRALSTGGRDDGYLQRLFQLVVWPTLSTDFQQSNNPEDMAAQECVRAMFNAVHSMQLERDAISQRLKPKALCFTLEAQDEFDKIYVARERDNRKNLEAKPVLAAHRGKMVGTLIKLSLICALLENPRAQHIDRNSLETALRLVSFYFTHAKRAYMAATRGGVLAAHALLAKIKAGKVPNPFSARDDIYEKKWAGLNTADTHEAICILIEHGYLHTEEVLTAGRPRRVYFINPICTGV